MTAGVIKSQGTELFLIDNVTSSEAAIIKMACPTGITGLGAGAKTQIDITCLDALEDQEYMSGLGSPGQMSVPFNFIPSARAHQGILTDLKGQTLPFLTAFSDGTALPTLSPQDTFVPPALRTSAEFDAYIADVSIDAATNDRVTGTLTLQRSGSVTWHFNGPIPQ